MQRGVIALLKQIPVFLSRTGARPEWVGTRKRHAYPSTAIPILFIDGTCISPVLPRKPSALAGPVD